MLFWLLACAALGGLIGYLLAGVNNRDTTAGAVTGTVIGGAVIAVPMMLNEAVHSLGDHHPVLGGFLILFVVLGVLINFFFGDLFSSGRR